MNTDIAAAFLSVGGEGNQGGEQQKGKQGDTSYGLHFFPPRKGFGIKPSGIPPGMRYSIAPALSR